jgi:hypothetical protein
MDAQDNNVVNDVPLRELIATKPLKSHQFQNELLLTHIHYSEPRAVPAQLQSDEVPVMQVGSGDETMRIKF